ncbi:hypothetical protein OXX80_004901 [Metschnikowia pulcherrima]
MAELLGTVVVVPGPNRGSGVLKYVGNIRGKPGTFGGIELQGPVAAARGKNSGDVDGVRYFEVSQPMAGLFLPWDRLRAANPSLPAAERLRTRSLSSKRDSVSTPTPSRRSSPSPRVFNGHTGPAQPTRPFSRSNSVHREMRRSDSYSKTSFGGRLQPENDSSAELAELRSQLDLKTREFDRKEAILLDLQATVDQLHPVLEEYERNLEEKERKLKKQKAEYDRAREEWRSSLDLMLSSQQEAENLYEMQISDLKEEIRGLVARSSQFSHHSDSAETDAERTALRAENEQLRSRLDSLQMQLEALQKENDTLRAENSETEASTGVSLKTGNFEEDDSELVAQLKKKVEMLTQDVTSMEIVLEDAQAKARAKGVEVAELEIKLEELSSENVANLSDQIVGMSLDDWEKDKSQYQKKIESLEQKLEAATKGSGTVSETAKANELVIAELREKESAKEAIISQLQQKTKTFETDTIKNGNPASQLEDTRHVDETAAFEREQQELKSTISSLKKELDTRPAYDDNELNELQNSLEMVETLHRNEMTNLQREFELSREKNAKMETELAALQQKLAEISVGAQDPASSQHSSIELPRTPFQVQEGGSLPIYKPAKEVDPSEGRDDWCGLCERDGHSSLNCPYENDMF